MARKRQKDGIGGAGQLRWDNRGRTAMTVQLGHDINYDARQDSLDKSVWTGRPDGSAWTCKPGQDR
jgi:hypothetical protein